LTEFKAVYFDRDGTISRKHKGNAELKNQYIRKILNDQSFSVDSNTQWDAMCAVAEKYPELNIMENKIRTISEEERFWKLVHEEILRVANYSGDIQEAAVRIIQEFSYELMFEPFTETELVFKSLKAHGVKIGIISDTSPSLERTIEAMGLSKYVDAVVSSSEVGVFKPDPKVYNTALDKLGLTAEECIYIDDYDVESDGARELGFVSFNIKRGQKVNKKNWEIEDLREVLDYMCVAYEYDEY